MRSWFGYESHSSSISYKIQIALQNRRGYVIWQTSYRNLRMNIQNDLFKSEITVHFNRCPIDSNGVHIPTNLCRQAQRAENASIARDSHSQPPRSRFITNHLLPHHLSNAKREGRRKEQVSLIHNHAFYKVSQEDMRSHILQFLKNMGSLEMGYKTSDFYMVTLYP